MSAAVLFVDDSPLARAATSRLLGERGVRVLALGSRGEALGVDALSFRAALLDLELPDGLGTEVAAQLRDDAPAIPIAFLTGGGPPSIVDAARLLGPVFSKTADIEAAVAWVVAAVFP
jgi:CheY-like chemotaxis protein